MKKTYLLFLGVFAFLLNTGWSQNVDSKLGLNNDYFYVPKMGFYKNLKSIDSYTINERAKELFKNRNNGYALIQYRSIGVGDNIRRINVGTSVLTWTPKEDLVMSLNLNGIKKLYFYNRKYIDSIDQKIDSISKGFQEEYINTFRKMNEMESNISKDIYLNLDEYKKILKEEIRKEIIEEIKREYKLVPIDQN